MQIKTQKLLEVLRNKKIGVFIDDANLFYAKKKVGWQIDFAKLKKVLSERAEIICFNYYIGMPASDDKAYQQSKDYLDKIKGVVKIRAKQLKYIKKGSAFIKKGDVDLEIAVDIMRNLDNLDVVVIVSGDSDYIELREFILEKGKQIIFFAFRENIAWEIRKGKFLFLNDLKEDIKL